MLRGNHEEDTINSLYGFRDEVMEKYDMDMYLEIQDLFRHLPVAATVNEKVFVSHGGIGSGLFSLDDLRSLEDRQGLASMSGVLGDLLWSDPGPEDGTSDNLRGVSVVWGPDVTQSFLTSNSLELIIRSHECVMTGYTRSGKTLIMTNDPSLIMSSGVTMTRWSRCSAPPTTVTSRGTWGPWSPSGGPR